MQKSLKIQILKYPAAVQGLPSPGFSVRTSQFYPTCTLQEKEICEESTTRATKNLTYNRVQLRPLACNLRKLQTAVCVLRSWAGAMIQSYISFLTAFFEDFAQ